MAKSYGEVYDLRLIMLRGHLSAPLHPRPTLTAGTFHQCQQVSIRGPRAIIGVLFLLAYVFLLAPSRKSTRFKHIQAVL